VKDGRTIREQVVGYDSPMASPPEDFRAHDRAGALAAMDDQFGEPFPEWRCQRVVRISPETLVPPERVSRGLRVSLASPQATQGSYMPISDLPLGESVGQDVDVELGIGAGPRHLADVDDHVGSDRLKEIGDLVDGPGGMTNREERSLRTRNRGRHDGAPAPWARLVR
jgi:hypothetical protein